MVNFTVSAVVPLFHGLRRRYRRAHALCTVVLCGIVKGKRGARLQLSSLAAVPRRALQKFRAHRRGSRPCCAVWAMVLNQPPRCLPLWMCIVSEERACAVVQRSLVWL